jgi:hypothetical protein
VAEKTIALPPSPSGLNLRRLAGVAAGDVIQVHPIRVDICKDFVARGVYCCEDLAHHRFFVYPPTRQQSQTMLNAIDTMSSFAGRANTVQAKPCLRHETATLAPGYAHALAARCAR